MTARAGPAGSAWMTLGEASDFLGVDASTLRVWADAGRIPIFRTPGGHRRFSRESLEEFLKHGSRGTEPRLADLIGPHARALVPGVVERIRAQRWYKALDGASAKAIGTVCHELMDALAGYMKGGVRQRDYLKAGERAGQALGARVAALSLPPSDATEAFLFFKGVITDAVATRLPLSPDGKVRSLRRVETFLNRVMLQMMAAHERVAASSASPAPKTQNP